MSGWRWDDIGHALLLVIFFGLIIYAMVHMGGPPGCGDQC